MNAWRRLQVFVQHDLWELSPAELRPLARAATRLLRFLIVLGWDFREAALSLRAMGLVYVTLLSLVPFLAVAFSVLKAFGVHQQLAPLLAHAFEPLGKQGAEVARQTIAFVDRLRVGVLGALGVAGLFLTVISLLSKVEDALNQIWRVRHPRSFGRKFTDYLSVVLVGPVLVFTALALTASAQSHWIMRRLVAVGPVGAYLVALASRVLPGVFLCVAFTFLYRFMPHTRVRLASALVGGATAAVLWQVGGTAFTAFVATSPSYAAIYSGFAILILFLLWLDYAWLVILVGAEVAYLHQHPATHLPQALRRAPSQVLREGLALWALVAVTRHYLAGERPWRVADLAGHLHVPPSILEDLVDGLVRGGILLRAAEPAGIALARPPEQVTAVEVLETLGSTGRGAARPSWADDEVSRVLARRDAAVRTALEGVTLRALAAREGEPLELSSSPSGRR